MGVSKQDSTVLTWHNRRDNDSTLPFAVYFSDDSETPTLRPAPSVMLPLAERVPGEDGLIIIGRRRNP